MVDEDRVVSRGGTGKALVLLAAAVLLAVSGVVCFLVLVFGPLSGRGSPVAGAIAYALITLVSVAGAGWVAIRARSGRRTVVVGCGVLIVGTVVAVGVLLVLLAS